jgi:transketolase
MQRQLTPQELDILSKTVSMLSVDAVQAANSGHPGLPMGASYYASLLWAEYLRFDPVDTRWENRDRFVLSAGHGSMLLYSLLHLFGYDVSMDQIKKFRQLGSKTPGHPEFKHTPGVEATTGPLGQGFANGIGMALSGKMLKAQFGSDLFDYRVFGIVSDGDLMEGISSEAGSLAGHLGLGNIVYLYDDNKITLAGTTDVCFTESVPKRFEALGWHVASTTSRDHAGLRSCIDKAIAETSKPSLICVRSVIGEGSPKKAGTFDVHGSPLGNDERVATRKNIGWPEDKDFYIPDETRTLCKELLNTKKTIYTEWNIKREAEFIKDQAKATLFKKYTTQEVSIELEKTLLAGVGQTKPEATRSLSGKIIQTLAEHMPNFVGGSADLESSTKTLIKNSTEIQKDNFSGRNIRYGVREHAMGAIANGLAYEGMWLPMVSTFLVFSDYLRPTIRLAALSKQQVLYVFTHDSIWVGEDGPTHEPIEQIASLRLIPNLYVFRPADGLETSVSYLAALKKTTAPSAIICSRQDLPAIPRQANFDSKQILRGGYVVKDSPDCELTLVATGSEVSLALEASEILLTQGTNCRVVSLPCVDLFMEQDEEYRSSVIPVTQPAISIEAGVTAGWHKVLGPVSFAIGIDTFGDSAPGQVLAEKYGLVPEKIALKVQTLIATLQ